MSKRSDLQKEYYQANGNYKGNGKYCDKYVSWLEEQVLALRKTDVSGSVCPDCVGDAFSEMSKEKEAELISVLAHFYKEIPLALEKKIISTAELSTEERDNAEIEMYEELKTQNRLRHCH